MAEAVLLVGTKKGLWIGRSDESRRSWTWSDPEFLMQGVYATCIDTRGDSPRVFASGTSEHFGPTVYRSDDLGRTWNQPQGMTVKFPEGLDSQPRAGLADPTRPGRRSRRALRRQPTVGAVPVDRPRRVVRARPLVVGPPAPARLGRRVRRSSHPHDRASSRRRAAAHRGDVHRWRLPDRRRREQLEPGQPGDQGLLLPRPVARVRPVRAQGCRPPGPAGTDVRPEPPRGLPFRRRRPAVDVDRRRAAVRLRVPDRGAPARPGHDLRLPAGGRRRADTARRACSGLALDRCRGDLDPVDRRAARPFLRSRHARRLYDRQRGPDGPVLRCSRRHGIRQSRRRRVLD